MTKTLAAILSTAALPLASCGAETNGDGDSQAVSTPAPSAGVQVGPFMVAEQGEFDEPWAAAFIPGTSMLFITEKPGTARIADTETGRQISVSGLPQVDYGGQGGLGDVAFLEAESAGTVGERTIYLTWAEAGSGDTRGAALGRGTLNCEQADACAIENLSVIWRQTPKVTGRGHYSHRIAFSPDGQYLFLASGDRQKMEPAQDLSNTLGTVLRLTLDGEAAPSNPFADRGSPSDQIWSYGHRNTLGLQFDPEGQLWNLEHGPRGGDELNRVQRGENYGWPLVSNGIHYDGGDIADHSTRPEFVPPVVGWTPVIAPGDFIFYTGSMFDDWRGDAIIATMKPTGIVRVSFDGESGEEVGRYPFDERIREIVQGSDGAIWVLEDGESGRLLRLMPAGG